MQSLQAKEQKPGLASYRERKGDPLTAVIEGNLKTPEGGTCLAGEEWPGVDEVLGPGQWWPGRTRPGVARSRRGAWARPVVARAARR